MRGRRLGARSGNEAIGGLRLYRVGQYQARTRGRSTPRGPAAAACRPERRLLSGKNAPHAVKVLDGDAGLDCGGSDVRVFLMDRDALVVASCRIKQDIEMLSMSVDIKVGSYYVGLLW